MTYEEFVEKELKDIGVDCVDELFALGLEPQIVNNRWTWVQKVSLPNTATTTQPHTSVSVFIPLN